MVGPLPVPEVTVGLLRLQERVKEIGMDGVFFPPIADPTPENVESFFKAK